jgi:LDH2 family malate/lactate/ureidoglycolate dehydrogenase
MARTTSLSTDAPPESTASISPTYIPASTAEKFATAILAGNGVPPENAAIIARCLVLADLRGVDTHGINRLPSCMARIRQGVLDPKASPTLTKITPVIAR